MSAPAKVRVARERPREVRERMAESCETGGHGEEMKMREGATMEARSRVSQGTDTGLRPLTKRELDGMIADVAAEVAASFEDVPPVRLTYLGEEIFAIPMDTRRFIRVMSRYMNFN